MRATPIATLEECVLEAITDVSQLPSGARVDHVDFGERRDGPGWWWSATAVQYHRLGSGPSATPDPDRARLNVQALIARSLEVAADHARPTGEAEGGDS